MSVSRHALISLRVQALAPRLDAVRLAANGRALAGQAAGWKARWALMGLFVRLAASLASAPSPPECFHVPRRASRRRASFSRASVVHHFSRPSLHHYAARGPWRSPQHYRYCAPSAEPIQQEAYRATGITDHTSTVRQASICRSRAIQFHNSEGDTTNSPALLHCGNTPGASTSRSPRSLTTAGAALGGRRPAQPARKAESAGLPALARAGARQLLNQPRSCTGYWGVRGRPTRATGRPRKCFIKTRVSSA